MNDLSKEASIVFAKKYLEDLLSFFGLNTDIHATSDEDVIELSVPTSHLNGFLIGERGETLRSLQYLVSNSLKNSGYELSRVNVDVADYKKQREEKVAEEARGWIEQVRATGDSHIASINAADRRVVHRIAAEYSDIRTYSEGEGRDRKIIIAQASS